jgi:F-type H+-transporting ATPase subunit epsilon
LEDKVTIMAEVAEWPEEIDLHRAEEAKIRAERRINQGGEGVSIDRAEAALRRSLARIEALK